VPAAWTIGWPPSASRTLRQTSHRPDSELDLLEPGLRIIQVCIWYTREGAGVAGAKVWSNADSNGSYWVSGPEVRTSATDSINPFDPPTVFNISTVRIAPGVI
jgi:hypothetical protein